MNEIDQEIKRRIGIMAYIKIRQAIKKSEQEKQKVYHVTKDKRTLENKEIIEKTYPNIKVMNEKEWLIHCYQKISPEERKKVDKKIIAEMERKT